MRLYFNKYSRGTRPRWLLEEAGLDCEIVTVDLANGEHRTEAYRAINPNGKVPVLVDGDQVLFESAAITLHLADKVPGFAPAVGTIERGVYYQWAFWAAVTLEPEVARVSAQAQKPEAERDTAAIEAAKHAHHANLAILDRALEGRTWILGDAFSAADVLLISILAWAGAMKLNQGFPNVEAYVARGKARPAFARARA